jgi:hypothetical protein
MKHTEADYITAGRRLEKATSPHAFAAQAQAIRHMLEQETPEDQTEGRRLVDRGRQDYRQSQK